jgi:hypothetical protein
MKQEKNFYKILSYALILIIVVLGAYLGIGYYGDTRYEQGYIDGSVQVNNFILSSLSQRGNLQVQVGNQSIVLVPSQMVQESLNRGYEGAVMQIFEGINKNGYVSVHNNDTEVILVPYTQNTNEATEPIQEN